MPMIDIGEPLDLHSEMEPQYVGVPIHVYTAIVAELARSSRYQATELLTQLEKPNGLD